MRSPLPLRPLLSGLLLAALTGAGLWAHRVDRAMVVSGKRHRLDPLLLRAVAMQETRLNPQARGASGEIGLFQIMPNTALHWANRTGNPNPSEAELFRVPLNTEIAAWYLRYNLDAFAHTDDPLAYALAAYNAGPSRAHKWLALLPDHVYFPSFIPFLTTRRYVHQILIAYRGPPP